MVTPGTTTAVGAASPRSPPRLRRTIAASNSPNRQGTRATAIRYGGTCLIILVMTLFASRIGNPEGGNTTYSAMDGRNVVAVQQGLRTTSTTTTTHPCTPTPNHTVIDTEDLELSCEQFRSKDTPSLEDVFGYLGSEQLTIAQKLRKRIVEWSLPHLRVDLGSGTSADKEGVLPTDMPVVDILNQTKLAALFAEGSISALRASHVFEHFTYPQAITAFQNIRCLLDPAVGRARIATPDAKHPDVEYHEHKLKADWPSGIFKASYRDDVYPGHRALWSESKMAVAASFAGLNARPLEWWSSETFCEQPYDGSNGFSIGRSAHRDKRNREKPLSYTSLIMDVTPQALNDWKRSNSS